MENRRQEVNKQKTLRGRFETNYMAVTVPADNKRGVRVKYVYYAPWHIWNLPTKEFRKIKIQILLASVVGFAIFCLSVSMLCPLNRNKIIFALSSLALCCHIMEFAALVTFLFAKNRTTKMTYEQVSRGLDFFPALRAVFMAVTTSASLAIMVLEGLSTIDVGVTAGYLVCTALAWKVHLCYKQIPFTTEENDALKQMEKKQQEIKREE